MKKLILIFIAVIVLPGVTQAEDNWKFALTPYAWFAGVKGNASTIPGAPVVPIEVTPSEALSDSQASAMVIFEAKQKKHGVLVDLMSTDSESDTTLVDAINLTLKSISRNKIYSGAYEYEFYSQDKTVIDVFAGVRYWKVDTIMEFGGGLGLLAGQRIRSAESWVDPMLGIKARTALGESKFYSVAWLSVGGFGVGSDSFYDVSVNIGYQWNKAIGTALGYRLFNVDYEIGSFLYDMQQEGLILGLTWAF